MAQIADDKEKEVKSPDLHDLESLETTSIRKGDILSLEHLDPVLNAKMHMVNDTIDEIGFTPYQAKLFCLNGFGYDVDRKRVPTAKAYNVQQICD
jgi:hypothetical protein